MDILWFYALASRQNMLKEAHLKKLSTNFLRLITDTALRRLLYLNKYLVYMNRLVL